MNTSLLALLSLAVVIAYVHVSEASAAREGSSAIEAGSPEEDEHLIEDDVDEEGAVDKRWMARLIRSPEKKWMARLIRSPEKKWMARLIRSPEKKWMARLIRRSAPQTGFVGARLLKRSPEPAGVMPSNAAAGERVNRK